MYAHITFTLLTHKRVCTCNMQLRSTVYTLTLQPQLKFITSDMILRVFPIKIMFQVYFLSFPLNQMQSSDRQNKRKLTWQSYDKSRQKQFKHSTIGGSEAASYSCVSGPKVGRGGSHHQKCTKTQMLHDTLHWRQGIACNKIRGGVPQAWTTLGKTKLQLKQYFQFCH